MSGAARRRTARAGRPEPEQEKVEVRVGAGGPDRVGEVGELAIVERPSSTGRAQRFAERSSRIGCDVAGVHGAGVDGAKGGDIRVINTTTGELLRHLTLDPTRGYQPRHKNQ